MRLRTSVPLAAIHSKPSYIAAACARQRNEQSHSGRHTGAERPREPKTRTRSAGRRALRDFAPLGLVLCALSLSCHTSRSPFDYVMFQDIAPKSLTLTQSWNAIGLDDRDRVYIIWTSRREDGREDSALFRYARSTGRREFLGTFIDVAAAQHNLRPGEEIPKGHTRIIQVGRKLYMASQGFHDFKAGIESLPSYRGAHLFTYDLDTGSFDDVTRTRPGGVWVEHQGVVTLSYSPEYGLLIGLTHPLGELVLYDVARGETRKIVPGIPWQRDHVVSREILVTRTGKVYTYRGAEDPSLRDTTNEVWAYDIARDQNKPTGQRLKGGFWNGQAQTRDRNTIYVSTVSGELYALHVANGRFEHLGYFIDRASFDEPQRVRVKYLYGIALTKAETELIGVPILNASAGGLVSAPQSTLISYDIASHTFKRRGDVSIAVFTGSEHRDRAGNIYMAAFDWDTNCRLAILPASRL